jgi:hypothetical protein
MRKRVVTHGGLLAAVITAAGVVPALAQSAAAPPAGAASWTAPRTPWGDRDISGNFSNKYELGTPFERPAEYEGRRLEDFSPQELAEIAQRRQELVLLNYPHQGDADNPAGNLGGPNTWGDRFEISKGSRPWFIVDPADEDAGADAGCASSRRRWCRPRRQQNVRAGAGGVMGCLAGSAERQLVRPLHHARLAGIDDADELRQLVHDRPGAGHRRDPLRDDS